MSADFLAFFFFLTFFFVGFSGSIVRVDVDGSVAAAAACDFLPFFFFLGAPVATSEDVAAELAVEKLVVVAAVEDVSKVAPLDST